MVCLSWTPKVVGRWPGWECREKSKESPSWGLQGCVGEWKGLSLTLKEGHNAEGLVHSSEEVRVCPEHWGGHTHFGFDVPSSMWWWGGGQGRRWTGSLGMWPCAGVGMWGKASWWFSYTPW